MSENNFLQTPGNLKIGDAPKIINNNTLNYYLRGVPLTQSGGRKTNFGYLLVWSFVYCGYYSNHPPRSLMHF